MFINVLLFQSKKCKQSCFPNTFEILNYLKNKYNLHIITNGFEETLVEFKI